MHPSRNLSSTFRPPSYIRMFSISFCTSHRLFGEVRYFLNKLCQRPFFKRYPNRDETLSSISGCDTSLNDALGMFGVRVVFHSERAALCNRLTRSSALIALHPDPYSEAHPSQRAAATERNAQSSRILRACLSQPFISLLMAVTQGSQLGNTEAAPSESTTQNVLAVCSTAIYVFRWHSM